MNLYSSGRYLTTVPPPKSDRYTFNNESGDIINGTDLISLQVLTVSDKYLTHLKSKLFNHCYIDSLNSPLKLTFERA